MKKNGFTLVELLAVLVILGIISMYAIPRATRSINRGRDKMYVADAKKLISSCELLIRSSSNNRKIIAPLPNQAILIGLKYIDDDSFSQSPHDGAYIQNGSFCLVKNNAGKMEYSATLVESMNGSNNCNNGCKGIILSKEKDLNLNKVTGITSTTLLKIDSVSVAKINEKLGSNYVSTISGRYS